MTDLFAFRTVRPAQRRSTQDLDLRLLPDLPQQIPGVTTHALPQQAEYGPFILQLIDALANPVAGESANQTAQRLAAAFRDTEAFVDANDQRRMARQRDSGVVGSFMIEWLMALDQWLTAHDNAPRPVDFEARIAEMLPAGPRPPPSSASASSAPGIGSSIRSPPPCSSAAARRWPRNSPGCGW